MTKQVPVVEGLFTWPSEKPQLIGTRCLACGKHYFPRRLSCNNPDCAEKMVEEVLLGRRGKVFSYTVQHYPSPPPFKYNQPFTPYGVGMVELPEGVMVVGMLTTADSNDIQVGMDVELTVESFYREDNGDELVTYKFRPVK